MKATLAGKHKALELFMDSLLSGEVGPQVATLALFGSVAKNRPRLESDIDVLVVALDRLEEVSSACAEIALDIMLKENQRIEYIVTCIDSYRRKDSYFLRKIGEEGKEIYSMSEEERSKGEARNHLSLAAEYLRQSRSNLELQNYRLLTDGAYNAAELAAKGLLLLKGKEIPKTHGAIVQLFAQEWVKSGDVSRELGRRFNKILETRNRARYDLHAEIGRNLAEETLQVAEAIVRELENRI